MLRGRTYEASKADRMYESKKVKRYRSAFTTSQINYLEKQFEKCPYIGSATRKEVGNLLRIPERAIKIWFQNRRMKEKKEVNNKEYNIESHDKLSINMEFAKDSLINAHSSQSANDRQCSLQLAKHVGTTNFSPYHDKSTFPNESKMNDLNNGTIDNRKTYKFNGGEITNIKQEVDRPVVSEPANLMQYNLNNSYNPNFFNYLELNKKSVPKSKVTPKTALNTENFRDSMLHVPPFPQYQDLPEDLSARNMSNVIISQNQGNIHLSQAYIPLCNTQDVCLSTGNVIWKPVNVIPAMPSNTLPLTVPKKQPSVNQNNLQKCNCDCNCHLRNGMNYDQRNTESAPQYVIAVPYGNNVILR